MLTSKINLIVIYISEAHARDEWPLSNKFVINQHKSIEERIKAVNFYIDTYKPIYKDLIYIDSFLSEENKMNIEKTYSCWPERGFVISQDLKFDYIAVARIEDLIRWPSEIKDHLSKRFKE